MSSVIGSAYTSATFLKTLHKSLLTKNNLIVIIFIVVSTLIFLFIGKPISLLIIAGAINGWILPIILGAILIASRKKSIVGDYKHPTWMLIFGIVAVIVTIVTGIFSLQDLATLWKAKFSIICTLVKCLYNSLRLFLLNFNRNGLFTSLY